MLQAHQVEELICLVSALDRPALVAHIRSYRASFPVDFTDDFLTTASIERIRHIFVALCMHCQCMPGLDVATPSAA
ncbi:MAG TPA: hypothetical protein VH370_14655 [Humisphaera sp.]|jgi:hypothetical protein|nr:hypothetical protein [Humisphaera sp.]